MNGKAIDSTIRQFYWNIVFLGFLIWCILNVNFSVVMGKIKTAKNRKEL